MSQQVEGGFWACCILTQPGSCHEAAQELQLLLRRCLVLPFAQVSPCNFKPHGTFGIFSVPCRRIDKKYRQMEKLGASFSGIVQAGSGGQYQPNPKADGFDVEKLCEEIDPDKVWKTPGQATGGATVTSAEAMRAARLARLSGGGGYAGGAAAAAPAPAAVPAAAPAGAALAPAS
ncbi:unnamed protein product [Effrenium voratum]|nr:unnamed protein product [Effrenium voratum]